MKETMEFYKEEASTIRNNFIEAEDALDAETQIVETILSKLDVETTAKVIRGLIGDTEVAEDRLLDKEIEDFIRDINDD